MSASAKRSCNLGMTSVGGFLLGECFLAALTASIPIGDDPGCFFFTLRGFPNSFAD
jgi:hypothetical protein